MSADATPMFGYPIFKPPTSFPHILLPTIWFYAGDQIYNVRTLAIENMGDIEGLFCDCGGKSCPCAVMDM